MRNHEENNMDPTIASQLRNFAREARDKHHLTLADDLDALLVLHDNGADAAEVIAAGANGNGGAALDGLLEGIAQKHIPLPAVAKSRGVKEALDAAFWCGAKVGGLVGASMPKKG
jgi:hypothetical protein